MSSPSGHGGEMKRRGYRPRLSVIVVEIPPGSNGGAIETRSGNKIGELYASQIERGEEINYRKTRGKSLMNRLRVAVRVMR